MAQSDTILFRESVMVKPSRLHNVNVNIVMNLMVFLCLIPQGREAARRSAT